MIPKHHYIPVLVGRWEGDVVCVCEEGGGEGGL